MKKIYEIAGLLTVNETYFFRESVHFDLLSSLLPQLAKEKKKIHICCAAVSTSCKAYSLAMLLDYHNQKNIPTDYEIDAFDISLQAVETAKNGRFTENTLRTDSSERKNIFELYLKKEGNEFIINKNIRNEPPRSRAPRYLQR
ncbi:MAG: hypothetical protein LBB81_00755 [Treponema sp.]|jgi:chemotaxis protein methyltransferase CheR|nr:hypothetical protein [Treponema sp.]